MYATGNSAYLFIYLLHALSVLVLIDLQPGLRLSENVLKA